MVAKLETAVIDLIDGETTARVPKLRKIKSSIRGIRSSFTRLSIDSTVDKELYMKVHKLETRFETCQGEVEELEIDFQVKEQEEVDKLRATVVIKAKNDAFDRNLVRLQNIEASISDGSSEQEKQAARSKLAVL